MEFKSIQEVIAFVESIPEDQIITGTVDNGRGQSCIGGHLNKAVSGSTQWGYAGKGDATAPLAALGISIERIVDLNDLNRENSKHSVLIYLNSLLPLTQTST